jgi:hypothetical protein
MIRAQHEKRRDDAMTICRICRFETEIDDVALQGAGTCVCVRCYARETGNVVRMPKNLRREIIAALTALEAA